MRKQDGIRTLSGFAFLWFITLLSKTHLANSAPPLEGGKRSNFGDSEVATDQNSKCNCDWRYLKHYATKGCEPVYGQEPCRCPVRFDCSKDIQKNEDKTVCLVEGRIFKIEEDVITSNNCEVCTCRKDIDTGKARLSCAQIECFGSFRSVHNPECYAVYDEKSCCPTGVKCDNQTEASEPVCRHAGKEYKLGQKIYPDEDPCLTCLCTKGWTGTDSPSCKKHNCQIERNLNRLQSGCVPIYHEKTCCPIEYHCPPDAVSNGRNNSAASRYDGPAICRLPAQFGNCHEAFPRYLYNVKRKSCDEFLYSGCGGNDNRFMTKTDCENTCGSGRLDITELASGNVDQCYYNQRYYAVGALLDIKHPTNCVTCACSVPPDFTCIHRSCSPPPNADYENCTAEYKPGTCCAQYTCTHSADRTSSPTLKHPGLGSSSSPTEKKLCPPGPSCLPGCAVIVKPSTEQESCPRYSCNCTNITPITTTLSPCIPPLDCHAPGCALESKRGECPQCVCQTEKPTVTVEPIRHLCAIPKCDAGCRLDKHLTNDTCPGCKCGEHIGIKETNGRSVRETKYCSPVDGRCAEHPGCRAILSRAGCPECQCNNDQKGTCVSPSCKCPTDAKCDEPGCQIESSAENLSECPMCRCSSARALHGNSRDRILCPSASKCPDGCQLTSAKSDGCPTCKCDRDDDRPCLPPLCLCSPPRCEPGCRVDRKVPLGRCPGCVCDLAHLDGARNADNDRPKTQTPHNTASRPQHGIAQRHDQRHDQRRPDCKPLSCQAPCRPETRPQTGQCPGCICRFETENLNPRSGGGISERRRNNGDYSESSQDNTCTPVRKCEGRSCKITTVNGRCPECVCVDERQNNAEVLTPTSHRCPPSTCNGNGCRAVTGSDGCPKCECRKQGCQEEESNCQDPCEWDERPKHGGCPRCLCPKNNDEGQPRPTMQRKCLSMSPSSCEGKDCRLEPTQDGCYTCNCRQQNDACNTRPPCSYPCNLENPSNGRCPICVCPADDDPYNS